MKRKIKFRGKKIDTGEWVFGSLLSLHPDICEVFFVESVDKYNGVKTVVAKVNPDTVGQFTGLLDKDGREIFEGHIISVRMDQCDKVGRFFCKTELPEYLNAQVKYNERQCRFEIVFQENKEGLISCDIGWNYEEFEVVGNVYDNPELLKGGA